MQLRIPFSGSSETTGRRLARRTGTIVTESGRAARSTGRAGAAAAPEVGRLARRATPVMTTAVRRSWLAAPAFAAGVRRLRSGADDDGSSTLAGGGHRGGKALGVLIAGVATGAAVMYFLDPHDGRRRRHVARDRSAALVRRRARAARRTAESTAKQAQGHATGAAVRAGQAVGGDPEREYNDPTLARVVETELFRDSSVPKSDILVNAENGVVYLRGEVGDPDLVAGIVARAREIDGVRDVESLLHAPGTSAPMKDSHGDGA